jgi:hypothetical protein
MRQRDFMTLQWEASLWIAWPGQAPMLPGSRISRFSSAQNVWSISRRLCRACLALLC